MKANSAGAQADGHGGRFGAAGTAGTAGVTAVVTVPMDQSRRVFGHLDTFEKVFSTVEDATVQFTEESFGLKRRTGKFYI